MNPQYYNSLKNPFSGVYFCSITDLKAFSNEANLDETVLLALQILPLTLPACVSQLPENETKVFFLSFVFGPHLHRQRYQDPPNVSTGAEQRVSFQSLWRPLWSSLCCSAALYRPSPELTLEKSLSGADPYQPLCTPVHMWKMGQHQNIHMCTLTYKYAESAFVGKEGAGSSISGSFLEWEENKD